jgi:hypothetical protein
MIDEYNYIKYQDTTLSVSTDAPTSEFGTAVC